MTVVVILDYCVNLVFIEKNEYFKVNFVKFRRQWRMATVDMELNVTGGR